jgi:hypothetical protein
MNKASTTKHTQGGLQALLFPTNGNLIQGRNKILRPNIADASIG